jgi:hypothetical protein
VRRSEVRNRSLNVTWIGEQVRNKTDILDDIVYQCARERFYRELEQEAPHCLKLVPEKLVPDEIADPTDDRTSASPSTTSLTQPQRQQQQQPRNVDTTEKPPEITSTATTNTTKPLPPFPWQWIHPMKTASSFANALYMLGCPEEFNSNWTGVELEEHSVRGGFGIVGASQDCRKRFTNGAVYDFFELGYTTPLRKKWWLGEHAYRDPSINDGQIFITVREPIDRIISHLYFQPRWQVQNVKTEEEMVKRLVKNNALDTSFFGQHMTALLSAPTPERPIPTAKTLEEKRALADNACKVVNRAAWVGLSDDYDRSICLLHAKYGFPRHPGETKNVRRSEVRNRSLNVTWIGEQVRNKTDILDDIVYQCARERFYRELEQEAPHCL